MVIYLLAAVLSAMMLRISASTPVWNSEQFHGVEL